MVGTASLTALCWCTLHMDDSRFLARLRDTSGGEAEPPPLAWLGRKEDEGSSSRMTTSWEANGRRAITVISMAWRWRARRMSDTWRNEEIGISNGQLF